VAAAAATVRGDRPPRRPAGGWPDRSAPKARCRVHTVRILSGLRRAPRPGPQRGLGPVV